MFKMAAGASPGGTAPVKMELRYAIEAKRAEKGLQMPVVLEHNKRPIPREVKRFLIQRVFIVLH